jgi:hypothetical protein
MKNRVVVLVALLVFSMMTHPQRQRYRRAAGFTRWGTLTGRRGRLTPVRPLLPFPGALLSAAHIQGTITERRRTPKTEPL